MNNSINFVHITDKIRAQVNNFIIEEWMSTEMILRGEVVDMTKVDGIVGFLNDKLVALITYRIGGDICEI